MNKLYFCFIAIMLVSCKKDAIINTDFLAQVNKNDKEGSIIAIDTVLIRSFKSKSLSEFYNSHDNETVWQLERNRKIILEHLKNCNAEGLDSLDYDIIGLEIPHTRDTNTGVSRIELSGRISALKSRYGKNICWR